MKQTASRTTILVGLAALAALMVFFFISVQRGAKTGNEFTPPVYLTNESSTALIRPLYLTAPRRGIEALSTEQKQLVADFKKKILNRIASSPVPLASQEKTVLAISIATTAKPALGDLVIADQSVFQFNAEELEVIARALES